MTYPDFGNLDPRRALVFLPMDDSFRQDVGENLITNGDFSAGTTGWTVGGGPPDAILSVETIDPAPGYPNWLKVDGQNGDDARQAVLFAGKEIHFLGWAKGDGGFCKPVVYVYNSVFVGTSSTTWQSFDAIVTPSANAVRLYLAEGSTTNPGYVGFAGMQAYEHPLVTRSLSLVPGSHNYARLGDGHTTGIPTRRSGGRGFEFDGTQYLDLDWAAGGPLDTTSFTFLIHAKPAAFTTSNRLFEIGNAIGRRYIFYYNVATEDVRLLVDGPTVNQIIAPRGYGSGSDVVLACAIDSAGARIMRDGEVIGTIAGDIRLPSLEAGSKAMIGSYPTDPTNPAFGFNGDIYQAAIFPGSLSNAQVREWGYRARQARNI